MSNGRTTGVEARGGDHHRRRTASVGTAFGAVGLAMLSTLAPTMPATAQAPIKLTFADQNPDSGWGPTHALKPWVKQVEEATKGRVKIDVYPSQTLVKGIDMWKAASAGTIDIGWCVQSYWPDLTPLSEVISLPALPIKSAEHGSAVLWKLYEKFPTMQKEFGEVQPLLLYSATPFFILSNKKQVKTLEDLKGMKIRVVGVPSTEQFKAFGVAPTPMPMPDVYQALDKGVIDAAGVPWEAALSFRLYEVAKNITIAPLSTVYFSVCANRRKMQSLPKEVLDQIMSVGGLEGARFWGRNFFDSAEQGMLAKAKESNVELNRYQLPPDEVARWTKIGGEPIWEEWVKRMEGKGHPEAREVLNTALALLKE